MKIVDLNLLLYAVNASAPGHERAFNWWNQALNEEEQIGLAWSVVLGFLRLTTRPGLFSRPLKAEQAIQVLDSWMSRPNVLALQPAARHWSILCELIRAAGTAGNLTSDAHLAALAIEYGATLYSSDNDFRRFGLGLTFVNPLE
ncbi:PIN domain-containing protein [bacterium CPR1]|nr:PIN domain-containing protein [bacterium CPR1]